MDQESEHSETTEQIVQREGPTDPGAKRTDRGGTTTPDWYFNADQHFRSDELELALLDVETGEAAEPENYNGSALKARILYGMGKYGESSLALERAGNQLGASLLGHKLLPADNMYASGFYSWMGCMHWRIAHREHNETEWQLAADAYHTSLQYDGTDADIWYKYGFVCSLLGDDAGAAEASRKSFEIDPNSWKRHVELRETAAEKANELIHQAGLKYEDDDLEAAGLRLREALNLSPSNPAGLTLEACLLYSSKEFSRAIGASARAIEIFEEQQRLEPLHYRGRRWLSNAYGVHGSALTLMAMAQPKPPDQKDLWMQALNSLEKSIELNSTSSESWYGLGISLRGLGRHQEAAIAFRKYAALTPNSRGYICVFWGELQLFHIGRALAALGQYTRAIWIESKEEDGNQGRKPSN